MEKGNTGGREIILFVSLVLTFSTFIVLSTYLGRMIETIKTGYVAEIGTSSIVVVSEPSRIFNVSLNCLQSQVKVGETIVAAINVTDEGPYEGDVEIEWRVEDGSGNIIVSDSTVVNMSIGYTWSANKGLIIPSGTSVGAYYFKVIGSAPYYDGDGLDTFSVYQSTTPPSGPGPSPGPSPPPSPPPTLNKTMEVYYPNTITVLVNTSKEFYLVVKNTGEANITSVFLVLQGLESGWYRITPVNVTLRTNETQVFTINLQVPADAEIKDYPISVTVVGDEISNPVQFVLSVKGVFDFTEIEKKIAFIEVQIGILKNETRTLEEKYIDVNDINDLISLIEVKLNETKQEVQAENAVRASELIYEMENIIEVVKAAIKAKQPIEVPMWSLFSVVLLLTICVVIMVSIVVVWFIMRKKGMKLGLIKKPEEEKKEKKTYKPEK